MHETLKEMQIRHEQESWARTVNMFVLLLESQARDKQSIENMIDAMKNRTNFIFRLVDRFPVLKKDLPEDMKSQYENRKKDDK